MKKTQFLLILIIICLTGCKTGKLVSDSSRNIIQTPGSAPGVDSSTVNYSEQTTWVLGYFNLNRLTSEPHSAWYMKGFDSYEFNSEAVNKLLEINKDDLSIKIIMGTWCPDSRREVPRFMRILTIWQFPIDKVTFIGVDDGKLSPVGEYVNLNIERVPTFIIYKNNIEAGRIIENPVTSLEQDIVNILTRNE